MVDSFSECPVVCSTSVGKYSIVNHTMLTIISIGILIRSECTLSSIDPKGLGNQERSAKVIVIDTSNGGVTATTGFTNTAQTSVCDVIVRPHTIHDIWKQIWILFEDWILVVNVVFLPWELTKVKTQKAKVQKARDGTKRDLRGNILKTGIWWRNVNRLIEIEYRGLTTGMSGLRSHPWIKHRAMTTRDLDFFVYYEIIRATNENAKRLIWIFSNLDNNNERIGFAWKLKFSLVNYT